jgi:hypothetical protein
VEQRPGIWVVGAGDSGRRHQVARAFRREGIVAIGPSQAIEQIEDEVARKEREIGRKLRAKVPGMLRRFAGHEDNGVEKGDIVILKNGITKIWDIGVLGDYKRDKNLGIAAWDLGHVRTANWAELKNDQCRRLERSMSKAFPRARFSQLSSGQETLRKEVERLVAEHNLQAPPTGPKLTHCLKPKEFVPEVKKAAPDAQINSSQLNQTLDVAKSFGTGEGEYRRLEADSVAMVLVPLLNSLGVELPRIRVEVPIGVLALAEGKKPAKRVDLVVFASGGIEEPILFVEVKRRWAGLDWASLQMDEYLRLMGREGAPTLITDGSEIQVGNIQNSPRKGSKPGFEDMSLEWLTEAGARLLARLADHLQRPTAHG